MKGKQIWLVHRYLRPVSSFEPRSAIGFRFNQSVGRADSINKYKQTHQELTTAYKQMIVSLFSSPSSAPRDRWEYNEIVEKRLEPNFLSSNPFRLEINLNPTSSFLKQETGHKFSSVTLCWINKKQHVNKTKSEEVIVGTMKDKRKTKYPIYHFVFS